MPLMWDARSTAILAGVLRAVILLSVLGVSPARADDPLPVIVTYETQHRRDLVQAVRRDPKAFWTSQILSRIEAKRTELPNEIGTMVTVQVSFTVARDGHLVRSIIDKSSGRPEVDRVAVGMVARAQPFPQMPEQLAESELIFVLPVRFR